MKILITGANGLLGQKLISLLAHKQEVEVVATSKGRNVNLYNLPFYHFRSLDITDPVEVHQVISEEKPDIIVHTAALTNVDQCERDKEDCWSVNVVAVSDLLEAAKKHRSFFIHLSTDFIFSGENGPLDEVTEADPINFYGKSKTEAELLVKQSGLDHAIIRTALVYGITPNMSRSNLVLWVKNSLERGEAIRVVDDQFRTPTLAEDLAEGCWLVAKNRVKGVFHISDEEIYTPYQMAILVARHFGLDEKLISKTNSKEFVQSARRPPKTGFIIEKAKQQLNYQPHSFKDGLSIVEAQIEELEKFQKS